MKKLVTNNCFVLIFSALILLFTNGVFSQGEIYFTTKNAESIKDNFKNQQDPIVQWNKIKSNFNFPVKQYSPVPDLNLIDSTTVSDVSRSSNSSPNWLWATEASGKGLDQMSGWATSTDNQGNQYFTGPFTGILIIGIDTLKSRGCTDIFILKVDSNGQFSWLQHAGGKGNDYAAAISISNNGDVYITGSYGGTGSFGSLIPPGPPVQFGQLNLTSYGGDDIFVAKLNSEGDWQWAKKAGGTTSFDAGQGLKADSLGNIYVTGTFAKTVFFDSLSFSTNISNFWAKDFFIAKYDFSGSLKWVVTGGGKGDDQATAITMKYSGNLILTGNYSDTLSLGVQQLISTGSTDIFVAGISPSGVWQWAKSAGGAGDDLGTGITIDKEGHIITTGYFQGTANWGTIIKTGSGQHSSFTSKSDSNGVWEWVTKASGSINVVSTGVTIDSLNNIYIAGFFSGTATFGPGPPTTSVSNSLDMFLCKYNSSGVYQWMKNLGGSGDDGFNSLSSNRSGILNMTGFIAPNHCIVRKADENGNFISTMQLGGNNIDWANFTDFAIDENGNTFVVGFFTGQCVFGNITLYSTPTIYIDIRDTFIAKIDAAGQWIWAQRAGIGSTGIQGNPKIAIDNSGFVYMVGLNAFASNFGNLTFNHQGGYVAKFNGEGVCSWVQPDCINSSPHHSLVNDISVDKIGNYYITGSYSGLATFGNYTVQSLGNIDLYIAKFNSEGICQYVKTIGGVNEYLYYSKISLDKKGKAYLSGNFEGNCNFNGTVLNNSNGTFFIARYNPEGDLDWVSQGGGDDHSNKIASIAIDNNNNSYITGFCNPGTVNFGNNHLNGGYGFIAKCDSLGFWKWAKEGFYGDSKANLYLDSCKNIYYITPFWWYRTIFDNITVFNSGIGCDISIAKADSSGNWKWAFAIGGQQNNYGQTSIFVDKDESIIIGGSFTDSTHFGNYTIGKGVGNASLFIAKFCCFAQVDAGPDKNVCRGDSVQLSATGGISYLWSPGFGLSCTDCQKPFANPTQDMKYCVYVTDENGCVGIDTVRIFVHPKPLVPELTRAGLMLQSSSPTGNQWYLNNMIIQGANFQTYQVKSNGNYKVVVTDANGCSASSISLNINNISIPDDFNRELVSVFPNPNNGKFTIEIQLDDCNLKIVNLIGDLIYSSELHSGKSEIDLSQYSKGFYFLQLSSENTRVIRKIIVQ